jgi:hypothetical protein
MIGFILVPFAGEKVALFGATKTNIAKLMTDSFGLPKYEMPKMEVPRGDS